MGKFKDRHRDTGVGTYDKSPTIRRRCCECGGPWDIGVPVKRFSDPAHMLHDTANQPHPDGTGWCWDCWDKRKIPGGVHA